MISNKRMNDFNVFITTVMFFADKLHFSIEEFATSVLLMLKKRVKRSEWTLPEILSSQLEFVLMTNTEALNNELKRLDALIDKVGVAPPGYLDELLKQRAKIQDILIEGYKKEHDL